ncbi:MAG: hypothetical protein LUI13_08290 [Lachnospiraceae bacterium]|nr:hypothetical protein [Lachnospiraceae bacterium]
MRWQEEQAEDIPCPAAEEEAHPVVEDRWAVMQAEVHRDLEAEAEVQRAARVDR